MHTRIKQNLSALVLPTKAPQANFDAEIPKVFHFLGIFDLNIKRRRALIPVVYTRLHKPLNQRTAYVLTFTLS